MDLLSCTGDAGVLIEGAWKQTCVRCGAGNNLRLHDDKKTAEKSQCSCQTDSIRTDAPQPIKPRPQSARRPYTPSNCYSYSMSGALGVYAPSYAPAGGGGYRVRPPAPPPAAFLAPFRTHRSVPAPQRRSQQRDPNNQRLLLKYTDAGIQKPQSNNARLSNSGSGATFPKLVTKYISRQSGRDGNGGSVYIETFRQNNKVAIVTQSFSM